MTQSSEQTKQAVSSNIDSKNRKIYRFVIKNKSQLNFND